MEKMLFNKLHKIGRIFLYWRSENACVRHQSILSRGDPPARMRVFCSPICNDPYSLELMSPDVAFPRSYYSLQILTHRTESHVGQKWQIAEPLYLNLPSYFLPRNTSLVSAHNVYKPLYFPKQI